jgi:hypothetical protein
MAETAASWGMRSRVQSVLSLAVPLTVYSLQYPLHCPMQSSLQYLLEYPLQYPLQCLLRIARRVCVACQGASTLRWSRAGCRTSRTQSLRCACASSRYVGPRHAVRRRCCNAVPSLQRARSHTNRCAVCASARFEPVEVTHVPHQTCSLARLHARTCTPTDTRTHAHTHSRAYARTHAHARTRTHALTHARAGDSAALVGVPAGQRVQRERAAEGCRRRVHVRTSEGACACAAYCHACSARNALGQRRRYLFTA